MNRVEGPPSPAHLATASTGARFQFSLRELLALMTFAAIAAAVSSAKGPRVFVVFAGFAVCYLNFRGAFARWQQGKWPWAWVGMSVALFAISLGLPAVGQLRGWQAAQSALEMTTDWIKSTSQFQSFLSIRFLWWVLVNLANLVLVLSPIWAWRLSAGRGEWYGTLTTISAVAAWNAAAWFKLGVGYYLWAAALLTMLSAWRIRRSALIAMALMAALFINGLTVV